MSQKQDAHLAQLHETLRQRAVDELAESDAQLLAWRAAGMTYAKIAAELGCNRARAHQRVVAATRRQELRP